MKETKFCIDSKRQNFSDFLVFTSKIATIPKLWSAADSKQLRNFLTVFQREKSLLFRVCNFTMLQKRVYSSRQSIQN